MGRPILHGRPAGLFFCRAVSVLAVQEYGSCVLPRKYKRVVRYDGTMFVGYKRYKGCLRKHVETGRRCRADSVRLANRKRGTASQEVVRGH